jgi:hypothetical protein
MCLADIRHFGFLAMTDRRQKLSSTHSAIGKNYLAHKQPSLKIV